MVISLSPCALIFGWMLFYGLDNNNLWFYFLVLSCCPSLLGCLSSGQLSVGTVGCNSSLSWKLVQLTPSFNSFSPASAGTCAVCHLKPLQRAGQPPSPAEMMQL